MPGTATLLMPGCAVAAALAPPPDLQAEARHAADSARTRCVMERFVELLYRKRRVRAAFESCVAPVGFVDHGAPQPDAPRGCSGRSDAMQKLRPQIAAPGLSVELLHLVADGDIGVLHLVARTEGQPARRRMDVYRIAGDRIVEHWGVGG